MLDPIATPPGMQPAVQLRQGIEEKSGPHIATWTQAWNIARGCNHAT
jgi:hypothetical protein